MDWIPRNQFNHIHRVISTTESKRKIASVPMEIGHIKTIDLALNTLNFTSLSCSFCSHHRYEMIPHHSPLRRAAASICLLGAANFAHK